MGLPGDRGEKGIMGKRGRRVSASRCYFVHVLAQSSAASFVVSSALAVTLTYKFVKCTYVLHVIVGYDFVDS